MFAPDPDFDRLRTTLLLAVCRRTQQRRPCTCPGQVLPRRRFALFQADSAGRGSPASYHSDRLLDDLVTLGMNAIHPIEPEAMDLGVVKAKYGERG